MDLLSIDEETARINELQQYNILDTLTEKDYDDITFMASIICDVPIALISFVDKNRQWFKSHKGLSISETPREYSFCDHALKRPSIPMVVPDSRKDHRFQDNPFVIGDPHIVFYAGIPLLNKNGIGLGAVCVIDTKPRELSDNQLAALKILSSQVMNLLEMRKSNANLLATKLQSDLRNTELENATKKLEASESQLRTISEGMNVLLIMSDINNKTIFFSKAWCTLSGKSLAELLDGGWVNLIHPEDKEQYMEKYSSAFEKRSSFSGEFRILNKSGSYTWLLSQGSPQTLSDGTFIGYISSTIDITELKQTELELSSTSKRLELALKAGKLGSYELDMATGNMETSLQCRANFGFDITDKFDFPELSATLFPNDLSTMRAAIDNAVITKTGYEAEYRIHLPNGEIRWIHASGLPVFNEESLAVKVTGVTHDVTAQKTFESELERQVTERTSELGEKNDELERMNKELQSFAYISSHDLQEPLRKIQAFTWRIIEKENEGLSNKAKDYFDRIQHAAKRMQILIDDLLSYSRTATLERIFEQVDLLRIINEVKDDLKEEIEAKQAIIESTEMCTVNIIPFQFKQLLHNLFTNALKFSKPGQPPIIKLSSRVAFGKHINNKRLFSETEYCHINVADNGIGFEPEYKEKIFELFQRLHGVSEYKGTGIGLAIVKKIVENHNGHITADSELGKGAKFDIYLPLRYKH